MCSSRQSLCRRVALWHALVHQLAASLCNALNARLCCDRGGVPSTAARWPLIERVPQTSLSIHKVSDIRVLAPDVLPPRPQSAYTTTPPHRPSKPCPATTAKLPLVDRPFRNSPLTLHSLDHPIKLRLDHDAAHDHLAQRGMQRLEVEDEVKLAHVLEEPVESLHKDLDEVEERER